MTLDEFSKEYSEDLERLKKNAGDKANFIYLAELRLARYARMERDNEVLSEDSTEFFENYYEE